MKYFFLLTMLGLGFLIRTEAQTFKIVSEQKPLTSIFILKNASAQEKRAASFLQKHVYKITTSMLPIQEVSHLPKKGIFIRQLNSLTNPDEFIVTTTKEKILIEGGNGKGCIYGVSELLERYGQINYYSPTFVLIPNSSSLSIPVTTIRNSSPNLYRNAHGQLSRDEDYRDFMRIHIIEDMFATGYYVHTFNKLVPWEQYFKPHPEYYALLNDKRNIDQLCLTNEDVFNITIQKLKHEMALQPTQKVWSVSQNDNYSYCTCTKCKKIIDNEGSAAGPIISFVNRVADSFPDKIISTLAYQFSRSAPKVIKPRKNVQIMLCTIELNRSKPIATDPSSASFLKDIVDWGKISNHIYLWDYTVDFAHSISPFPNLHTLQPNIQLFCNNNIKEHFQQSNTGTGHEFSELKSYLISKLLWNPSSNVDTLITKFTDGYYGPAAPWIRKYIYHMRNEVIKTGEWLDIYGPPTLHQKTFLSRQNTDLYNEYFDAAEKATIEDSAFFMHVKEARMPLQYAIMEIGKNDMFGSRGWYEQKDSEFVIKPKMVQTMNDFYKTGIAIASHPVNESGLTIEDYYNATKRFIDIQVKGNMAFRKKVTASPVPVTKYSNGDLSYLTNGVRGANDFKVHWLGWHSQNFTLTLDLEKNSMAKSIEISSLWDPKSWILHPTSITCYVSQNGTDYKTLETITNTGDQQKENVSRVYTFAPGSEPFRYVKFMVNGTLHLYDWHPSAGGESWVFIDEIVVK